jgi:ribose 5-phosphate isomerase
MPSNTHIHGRSLVGLGTGTTIKTYVFDLSYRYEISISQMTMDLSSITDKSEMMMISALYQTNTLS